MAVELKDTDREELAEISPTVEEVTTERHKTFVEGHSICSPGDVLFFSYANKSRIKPGERSNPTKRLVLAVANSKTKTATYTSHKKNKQGIYNQYLTAFTLQGNEEVIARILKKLYKNRNQSSYKKVISGVRMLLPPKSYRTYIITEIVGGGVKLQLDLSELEEEEEE